MTIPGSGPVVVAGGCGAVGTMLAAALRGDGHRVVLVDPAATRTGPEVLPGDIADPSPPAAAALRSAGTVILAVPDAVAVAALPALAEVVRPGALLVETLSVKTPVAAALHAQLPDREALGINPMFAPALGAAGRPVLAVRHRDGDAVGAFVDALHRWGMRVVEVGAAEHDRATAVSQALTHAVILAFGSALDRLAPPPAAAAAAPPPHVLLRALLARIASGTPAVYHDIQVANPYAAEARRALRDALDELDAADDPERFAELTVRGCHALGDEKDRYRALCGEVFAGLPSDLRGTGAVRNEVAP
ncbi:prephenate dehydrogenase/arogenate dehydrogenase family protein [Rhodococcus coprophilus]|uniref:Prephenate dehydratase n=1 Tax=Rhodococcus coprophilus TaxID=38310 RepID=A0A2X4TQL8_9NOCA|nr:prephenate dehydrogenase/arogenate dehydrogenase family protein [Rhodococcus coprophilus]MBM7460854.1 prephenate dehydrogenase [Rhodococcus coprophilus]SQI28659.1 prephenate dehydratase [Rhodococcus coprophilus]